MPGAAQGVAKLVVARFSVREMVEPNPAFRFGVRAVEARFEPEPNPEPNCPLLQSSWSPPGDKFWHSFGLNVAVLVVAGTSFWTPEKPESRPGSNAFERRTEPECGFRFGVQQMLEPNPAFAFSVRGKMART
ncbi:hypothetical protein C8F04DRAFT_1191632 [Mycena alexandri]|uniref:Uncharacterized protein n=1 Tax=Mycena alexandri TaxID=1745969 RepID=A0AAD6WY01_9AGAR|nr:hypothetical protein C8F04DRAFT_1191632 [Mycena alexandri]